MPGRSYATETLIAASIVYMCVENVVWPAPKTRWPMAFGFDLVHGFGFSFALQNTLQLAGDHVLTSLLAFNVIELGQLLVLLVPALNLLFRYVPERPRHRDRRARRAHGLALAA